MRAECYWHENLKKAYIGLTAFMSRSIVITVNHRTSAFLHRRIIAGEFIFWNVVLQTADIPEGKESMQVVTRLHSSTLPAGQILAMLFARWDGRRGGRSPDIRILRDLI